MTNKRLAKLSIKNLESYLQDLDDFNEPKLDLEQYATPPHIAALMLYTIDQTYNDINNKFVADLGCGTGRLTIGSLLCGASMVYGLDIDRIALTSTLKNVEDLFSDTDNNYQYPNSLYRDCESFNLIQVNVIDHEESKESNDNFWYYLNNKFDTVLMNPPFGTKNNQGIDLLFLRRAIELSNNVVYSLHKTSTREHILNKCTQWNTNAKPIAQIRYNLDNTYKFHRKKSVDIDVDLWRIVKKSK